MPTVPVLFVYKTSLPDWPPENSTVEIRGSWDGQGFYSDNWSSITMTPEVGDDFCREFTATVHLDTAQSGTWFSWGTAIHLPGTREVWGVPTEVKSMEDRSKHRRFQFDGSSKRQVYHLTQCHRLGANRYRRANGSEGIQFAVWAPNAMAVEVVMGTVWDTADPANTVLQRGIPLERLAGGYISDTGMGIDSHRGPFTLQQSGLGDGVWMTDPNQHGLEAFAPFDHLPYMFRIKRNDGGIKVFRTDIYSRCQIGFGGTNPKGAYYNGFVSGLDGGVSCSVVINPRTVTRHMSEDQPIWPEREFISEADFWQHEFSNEKPLRNHVNDLIIYELHVGALGFQSPRGGSLKDAKDLVPYLVALNVNAVELLPMSESQGPSQNWGYATSHHFALEFSGGGRDQLKHFVRECHRNGIVVIMDVVYNHFAHDAERAEEQYDSPWPDHNIYYWYEGTPFQHPKPENGYVQNNSSARAPRYHEEMVRSLFISSAVSLIREFHIDGFRVDQTTSIHEYNVLEGSDPAISVPPANAFGGKLLREFGRTLRMIKPDLLLMAEDHSAWDEVTMPVEAGGQGFNARWYAEYYHNLIGDTQLDNGSPTRLVWVAAKDGPNQALAMGSFSHILEQTKYGKIVFAESHDEAGNSGNGPFFDPEATDQGKTYTSHRTIVVATNGQPPHGAIRSIAEARCRFAYGMTVLSAGVPLFLFGEEVGAEKRFKYNTVLDNREDLHGLRIGSGKNIFAFYAAINQLRCRYPGLRSQNLEVVYSNDQNRILVFQRWEGPEFFLIVTSLADYSFPNGYVFQSSLLWNGLWNEVLNSDSHFFGGENIGNGGQSLRIVGGVINCVIPRSGIVVFQRIAD